MGAPAEYGPAFRQPQIRQTRMLVKNPAMTHLRRILWAALMSCAALPAVAAGPKIVCREPAHEFGAVEHTNVVRHTFAIGNEGDAALDISRVRACCGATAKLGTNTIAPGANTALEVALSLGGREGAVQKALYVQSNDPVQSCYQLKLTGTVVNRTGLSPSAVDFGRVESDKPASKDMTVSEMQVVPREIVVMASSNAPSPVTRHVMLSSKDRKRFKILGVEPPDSGIEVKVSEVRPYAYRCELSGIMPFPELDGKHVVFATDHPSAEQVRVPFRLP